MERKSAKPIMVIGTSAKHRREIAHRHFGDAYDLIGISPDIDEKQIRLPDPHALTRAIAHAKMTALLSRVADDAALLSQIQSRPGSVALTFDQVVDFQGEIREKPDTAEEARSFIKSYSRNHLATVMTTVLHAFRESGKEVSRTNTTMTFYNEIPDDAVERVIERGTCFSAAGAFVVEDIDMKRSEVKIDPGTEDDVRGFCAESVLELLKELKADENKVMNSFLQTLQHVVDLGQEDQEIGGASRDLPVQHSSTDPVVLRRHIDTLQVKLLRQIQLYEALRAESTSIEKELTRVRLRFAASRELWITTNGHLEHFIQTLLENKVLDPSVTGPLPPTCSVSSGLAGPFPGRPDSDFSSTTVDALYVASLQEQIQRLKEMVMRSGEERSQLRSVKLFDEAQPLLQLRRSTEAGPNDEVREALEKLIAYWNEERAGYESAIEKLESGVAKSSERVLLLRNFVQQQQQCIGQNAPAEEDTSVPSQEELKSLREELEQWRRGERYLTDVGCRKVASTESTTFGKTAANNNPTANQCGTGGVTPSPGAATFGPPTPDGISGGAKVQAGAPTPASGPENFAEELERLRRDCSARDEALDALYRDNRVLQQALLQTEAHARECDTVCVQCQGKLEEVNSQLEREKQRSEYLEENARRSAVTEAKLRDDILQLRRAAAAAATLPASSYAGRAPTEGTKIVAPQAVRANEPYNFSFAEQEVWRTKASVWDDCVREARLVWDELKGNTQPSLGHQLHRGVSGAVLHGVRPLRRASRLLLICGGPLVLLFLIVSLCYAIESTLTLLRTRDGL